MTSVAVRRYGKDCVPEGREWLHAYDGRVYTPVCRRLGVEYAPARVGNRKTPAGNRPIIDGVVVRAENAVLVREVCQRGGLSYLCPEKRTKWRHLPRPAREEGMRLWRAVCDEASYSVYRDWVLDHCGVSLPQCRGH